MPEAKKDGLSDVSKRHELDLWREIRMLYESKSKPSYKRIKEILVIEYDIEESAFPSESTVLRRRKKEGWIRKQDSGTVKDLKNQYNDDFWLCVKNVYESNPKISYKRLKEIVQNELQCVDFPSFPALKAKAKAQDWKSVEYLLAKSDGALKKVKKNVKNIVAVTVSVEKLERENFEEIQRLDPRFEDMQEDQYLDMMEAMRVEKSNIENLITNSQADIGDMAGIILNARRLLKSVNGYGALLLDNFMLNTQLLTSDKFMRNCPAGVLIDLEAQGKNLTRAVSTFSDLSFSMRESIKFELSLRGVGIDDLRETNTKTIMDDLEDESAYEAQKARLRQQREAIAANRRYIDSGGLQADCDEEMARRMQEANLEDEETDYVEMD